MQTNTRHDRLLTVASVAERLGVSPKTVRRELTSGALECVRVGPAGLSIRVTEQALAVYLATRKL